MASPRQPDAPPELSPEAQAEINESIQAAFEQIAFGEYILVVCNPGEDWFDAMLRTRREQRQHPSDKT